MKENQANNSPFGERMEEIQKALSECCPPPCCDPGPEFRACEEECDPPCDAFYGNSDPDDGEWPCEGNCTDGYPPTDEQEIESIRRRVEAAVGRPIANLSVRSVSQQELEDRATDMEIAEICEAIAANLSHVLVYRHGFERY